MQSAASVEAEGIGQILAMAGNPNDPVATAMGRTNVIYQLSVDDPATYASAWSDFSASTTSKRGLFHTYHQSSHTALIRLRMLLQTMFINPWAKHYRTSHRLMEGFDVFLQRVSGIRTVEGRMITTVIAEWRP